MWRKFFSLKNKVLAILIFHNNKSAEKIEEERSLEFYALPHEKRFKKAIQLIKLGMMFRPEMEKRKNIILIKGADGSV